MPPPDTPLSSPLQDALALQRQAYLAHPVPSLAERQRDLRTLQRFIREHKDASEAERATTSPRSIARNTSVELL